MNGASPELALIAGAVLLASLLGERHALTRGLRPYFDAGIRLVPPLVPLLAAPTGSGKTESVCWEVDPALPGRVRFWVEPRSRSSLGGLHGLVLFRAEAGRVVPEVRWSPPWTPLLAAIWLATVGSTRGEAVVSGVLAAGLVAVLMFAYRSAALRAAAELRWAWAAQGGDGPAEPTAGD